ncbi:hypothetical protein FJ250_05570 [bacterium]|nr:hypothetical protein [bacterium]
MTTPRGRRAALILAALAIAAAPAAAEELEGLLEDVTGEYAQAYLAPFTHSFGPNLNGGIFHTAAIPRSRLTIEFGVKATATHLAEEDQSFQTVIENVDLSDYDNTFASGTMGDIVMSGPTVFGDDEAMGSVAGYINGVQVFSQETIEGLVKTRYSPMAVPQASLAGIAGLRATVRWLPEVDLGEIGKTKVFGYGLQWGINTVAPTLPIDIMVGFFNQTVEVGTLIETDASSMFVAASKAFPLATIYAGYAKEDAETDIAYTYGGDDSAVAFTVEGTQESRFTVGATLNVLAKLNVEMGHGDLTTYTAGLMFGF